MEVCFGSFERVVDLPAKVDPASAQAAYREGFLQVTFRKHLPERVSRVIAVEG
jgi:HSP20 family molecular chaperone IbpA